MPVPYPKSAGWLYSFQSLRIPDGAGGQDVGIREISIKNTKEGRSKVFGSARRSLGFTSGRDNWEASIKWNLDHWTKWMVANAPYTDRIFDLTFQYIEEGQKYEIVLKDLLYKSEDHTATEGSDGGLEKQLEFFVGDVEQYVDGVKIAIRNPEPGEGA
jgi:hypothetical protein